MSNRKEREIKEMRSLFEDPKFARKAFRAVGGAILQRQASKPIQRYDKEGNETLESRIEGYTYLKLAEDVRKLTGDPNASPTELELIMACQAQMARINASNFIAFRDTVGGKPIDESKVDTTVNDYSGLTDEELEMLKEIRNKKAVEEQGASDVPAAEPSTDVPCDNLISNTGE